MAFRSYYRKFADKNKHFHGLGVKTLDGEIIFKVIQLEGKKKTTVKEYLNGIQDKNSLLGKVIW